MDIINILVTGENKSGKSTFVNALKLTKFSQHHVNVTKYNPNEKIKLNNYDVVFFVMNIEMTENYIDVNFFSELSQCVVIPVFNKLDIHEFTYDEKTHKILLENDIINITQHKLSYLHNLCEGFSEITCNDEMIVCSAEYSYLYLILSKCTKANAYSEPAVISKIGQYELGKLNWNKKNTNEKTSYAIATVDTLRKPAKLSNILSNIGYNVEHVINKYLTDQNMLYIVQKHLVNFQTYFNIIKNELKLIEILNYLNKNFTCANNESFLSTYSDITNITDDISNFINTYDYTQLNFREKSEVLQFYKTTESTLSKTINFTPNILFLTAMLSQEIETQLESCSTFFELVDKLYECLDINDNIFVDKILLNHKTFKMSLFSNELHANVDYALSKFELEELHVFFFQIMEMKLDVLLNLDHYEKGIIESMMCVEEFLDSHPELILKVNLRKYKILLKHALMSHMYKSDKNILIEKIDDENTLYVETTYYDLMFSEDENTSIETEENEENEDVELIEVEEKHPKEKNKSKCNGKYLNKV